MRILSPAGKKYKKETKTHLIREFPKELQYFVANEPYCLLVVFMFSSPEQLLNKGYPKKTESRYKKLDASNRLKLLEDALAEATGLDDAHNWMVVLHKVTGAMDSTHIFAWNMENDPGPLVNTVLSIESIGGL